MNYWGLILCSGAMWLEGGWLSGPLQERDGAPPRAERQPLEAPVVLARITYLWRLNTDQPEPRVLTLWKHKLSTPAPIESDGDSLKGEVAFVLVDSETGSPKTGRVVWIVYGQSGDLTGKPTPIYSWDILCGMKGQVPHLVAVRSEGKKVLAAVYHLDPSKELGAYPLKWEAADPKRRGGPSGAKP